MFVPGQIGNFVQEYWREKSSLHINVKELSAAICTVKSLAKPGETVSLSVDNQVIYYYLTKGGGRKNPFNAMLRPFSKWCKNQKITLNVNWVPSEKMLADPLSRWEIDRGDYSLDPLLFQWLKKIFSPHIDLETDLFASQATKITQICVKMAPLGGHQSKCPGMPIGKHGRFVCQPPMVNNPQISSTSAGFSTSQNFDGRPLLGFSNLVAPINKIENTRGPLPKNHPLQGYVHKLHGGVHAPPTMAPNKRL